MVLGGIWVPSTSVKQISSKIREIKRQYGLDPRFEIKWTKVSPSKISFYQDLIDYFFNTRDLHFRAVVINNKEKLRHDDFDQDHDSWYYKMYFIMLKAILSPYDSYRIYLDIKDTRGSEKVSKLHDVLSNSMYDFSKDIIERIQQIRSHEVEIIQLADLFIGAINYANRGLTTSLAKLELVNKIRKCSGYNLTRSTLLRENKLNILVWNHQEVE